MKHIVIETEDGLMELDAVPTEPPRVTLGPKKAEAPKPKKRKAKEVDDGASDQT